MRAWSEAPKVQQTSLHPALHDEYSSVMSQISAVDNLRIPLEVAWLLRLLRLLKNPSRVLEEAWYELRLVWFHESIEALLLLPGLLLELAVLDAQLDVLVLDH